MNTSCNNSFTGYSSIILRIKSVIINKKYAKIIAKPKQNINETLNQKEEDEVYDVKTGFFQMICDEKPPFTFHERSSPHLNKWLSVFSFQKKNTVYTKLSQISKFTIVTMRYEYSNIYWTIVDLFDIYLTASFFNKSATATNVLIIDQRPKSKLDDLYKVIFNATFLSDIQEVSIFKDLAFNFGRYFSPFLIKNKKIPLLTSFRKIVLRAFHIPDNHVKNCQKLNIVMILRRDYVAHPRNPNGFISRKIRNEKELQLSIIWANN